MKQLTDEVFAQVRETVVNARNRLGATRMSVGGEDEAALWDQYTTQLAALDTAQPEPVNAMLVEALEKVCEVSARCFSHATWEAMHEIADKALTASKQAQPEQSKLCLFGGNCKHGDWCTEVYCQELCKFKQAQPEPPIACMVKGKLLSYKDSLIPEDCFLYLGPQPQQAQPECECTFAQKTVGDGCAVCNPKLAAELSQPERAPLSDAEIERDHLLSLLAEVSANFTRDDDLPDDLLPRIDSAIKQGGQHD